MEAFNHIIGIISKAVIGIGSLITAMGGFSLGAAIKEHNGPQTQQALAQIVGGVIIFGVGMYLTQIKVS